MLLYGPPPENLEGGCSQRIGYHPPDTQKSKKRLTCFSWNILTYVMSKKLNPDIIVRKKIEAIEIMASNVNLDVSEIAKKLGLGITAGTIQGWMKNADFIRQVYDKFMVLSEIHLTEVVMAMVREAKCGNVPAARLVLEHYGKLENKIKLQIESPFDKWLHSKNNGHEITPVEVFESVDVEEDAFDRLPERIDYKGKEQHDQVALNVAVKEAKKKMSRKEKNRIYNERKSRAKAVGLERLKVKGRPRSGAMRRWLLELEIKEIQEFGKIQTKDDFAENLEFKLQ